MPIYEYRCSSCGERFEELVRSVSSQDTVKCPHCGSEDVEKAISLFGVGSGSRSGSGASCAPTNSL